MANKPIHVSKGLVDRAGALMRYQRLRRIANTGPHPVLAEAELEDAPLGPFVTRIPVDAAEVRVAGIGRCIYCGALDHSEGHARRLGEEHVVPTALGGTVVLPAASCAECERATSRAESKVISSIFAGTRIRLGLRGRSKLNRRKIPITFVVNGRDVAVPLEVDSNHPTSLALPEFRLPGLNTVQPDGLPGVRGFWMYWFPDDPDTHNEQDIATAGVDILSFSQFLAKIGHAYAAVVLGVGTWRPYLREIIRRQPARLDPMDQSIHEFVGGVEGHFRATEALHELALSVDDFLGTRLIHVRIRLFSILGAPLYSVLVGELVGPVDERELAERIAKQDWRGRIERP